MKLSSLQEAKYHKRPSYKEVEKQFNKISNLEMMRNMRKKYGYDFPWAQWVYSGDSDAIGLEFQAKENVDVTQFIPVIRDLFHEYNVPYTDVNVEHNSVTVWYRR